MKKSILALALIGGMFLASSCATIDGMGSEQEEEITQATPGGGTSTYNNRWETGDWDRDYASE